MQTPSLPSGTFLLFLLAAAAGCSGPSRSPVRGAVTVNGKPMDKGGIQFVPLDKVPVATKVGGPVADGAYALDASRGPYPGRYRVQIFWDRPTGRKVSNGDFGMYDESKEGLPAKYNVESELTAVVTSGANTLDFNLTP